MVDEITIEGIKVPIGSHEGKTVIIGSDHRGFDYKTVVMKMFAENGYEVIDVGTSNDERCDYPAISNDIGRRVSEDPNGRVGIGICGSGIGILIPAGKHKGVYGARCLSAKEASSTRMHNNTNLLGIGTDCVDLETAIDTVYAWMTTPFCSDIENERSYLNRYVQTVKLEDALR